MRIRSLTLSLAFFLPVVLALPAAAQSFTPVRELKNLSPAALDKIHTLETLNALPGGDWRYHVGDIPHGESPTLDDASWQLLAAPATKSAQIIAPKEAVWYRRTIEVPRTLNGYDITGSRVLFQFKVDANGPIPQIIYFNGRRVALGDDLEPIVLFEPARPGDKILVAVKLLHTVDEKRWQGVSLAIQPTEATASRPSPDDLRQEIISAANMLPALPTPRPDLLKTVEEAAAAIDTAALTAGNQQAFDASLRKAEFLLSPLHALISKDKVILAGNAHIDAAWLWPRSETIDVVKRTFTTALQLMDEYPDYTYTQSAAQYSAWIADKYPDLNKQIAARVKEGRWEIVGGMWIEPDLNLPGGESLVRQLLVGQREFQRLYGVTARIGWNPDSFGYNWQLPQIYKRSGLDYFVTQKMHWNDTNTLPFRLFWWQSPDGSKVLTYFPTDYVHDNVNPTRISADFAESAQRNPGLSEHLDLYGIGDHGGGPTRSMLDQANHWIAISNASSDFSSRPDPEQAKRAEGEAERPASGTTTAPAPIPTLHYGTAQTFFNDIEPHISPNSPTWNYDSIAKGYTPPQPDKPGDFGLPTWNSELYFEYHRGVFTTQAAHKRNMRTSETQTLDAEKLASLAWLDGAPYPADILTENWKQITFNQFHDLAAGSGVAVIYRDAQNDFTEVANADKLIDESALNTIGAHINTIGKGTPIVVTNTLPWARNEPVIVNVQLSDATKGVSLFDGHHYSVPSQVLSSDPATHTYKLLAYPTEMPALGYTTIYAEPAVPSATTGVDFQKIVNNGVKLEQTDSTFEFSNLKLKVVIDKKTGCVVSLVTLPMKMEHLASDACGNQLQAYADNPKNYDAWNVDPGTFDKAPSIISDVDSISVTEDGPRRKTIRVSRTWQKSKFVQDISIDAWSDFVRVDTTVDWHEDHVLLKAAFPLAHSGPKATYEIPYGAIERPTTRNNSWEQAQFEVPALRWADLGDSTAGVSILNDSKYGYDALGNTLRLTLLRSPTWPDPDADRGTQHFTYEIYPHTGTWQTAQTVHRGYELNTPLTAQQVFPHTGSLPPSHSFASIDEPNIILSAVKKAEDTNALIFRFYDSNGKGTAAHLHVPPGALYAIETNLMETPIPNAPHLNVTNDTITLPIHPWEIRTLQVIYPQK
jgi:alpha-mannosidase